MFISGVARTASNIGSSDEKTGSSDAKNFSRISPIPTFPQHGSEKGQYVCAAKFLSNDDSISSIMKEFVPQFDEITKEFVPQFDEISQANRKQKEDEISDEMDFQGTESHMGTTTKPLAVSGLHTCGDLASVTLKLFCRDPNVKIVAAVGCCYHHLSEQSNNQRLYRYENNSGEQIIRSDIDFSNHGNERNNLGNKDFEPKNKFPSPSSPGFPLSKALLASGFSLGRNARMIAAQPPGRLALGEVSVIKKKNKKKANT